MESPLLASLCYHPRSICPGVDRLDQARHELFVPILSIPWLNTNIQIWQILLVWFLTNTVFNWALHFLVIESATFSLFDISSWPDSFKESRCKHSIFTYFYFREKCTFKKDFFPTRIKPTALCCQPESQWRVRQTWSAFCSRLLAWLLGWFVKIFKTF